jgi:predicted metalloprotease with PDZ domain
VKRLRPAELGPWDWTRPANTKGLWIAEGFTQYYGDMMLRRAGLEDDSAAIRSLARTLGTVENDPGNKLMSAEAASMAAPFIDDAVSKQRTNLSNSSISYYSKGELIAAVLDLQIRGKSKDQHSLDEVMRRAYDEFYAKSVNASYYLKGRGYTEEDFMRVVSQVAGWDAMDFFNRYIRGVEPLPYDEAFGYAGLRLVKQPSRQPHTGGIVVDRADRQSLRLENVHNNSEAERAGLQQDDVLVSIGGTPVTPQNWRMILNQFKEGERIPITAMRFHKNIELTLVLGPADAFNYSIEEIPNASPEQKALRTAWLAGSR